MKSASLMGHAYVRRVLTSGTALHASTCHAHAPMAKPQSSGFKVRDFGAQAPQQVRGDTCTMQCGECIACGRRVQDNSGHTVITWTYHMHGCCTSRPMQTVDMAHADGHTKSHTCTSSYLRVCDWDPLSVSIGALQMQVQNTMGLLCVRWELAWSVHGVLHIACCFSNASQSQTEVGAR